MSKGKSALINWCKRCTENYKGVSIVDFSNSWKDGLGFCALLHFYDSSLFSFDQLKSINIDSNLNLALTKAKELKLSVKTKAQDIKNGEELSIIEFLIEIYENLKKKRNKRDSIFGEIIDMRKEFKQIKADIKEPLKRLGKFQTNAKKLEDMRLSRVKIDISRDLPSRKTLEIRKKEERENEKIRHLEFERLKEEPVDRKEKKKSIIMQMGNGGEGISLQALMSAKKMVQGNAAPKKMPEKQGMVPKMPAKKENPSLVKNKQNIELNKSPTVKKNFNPIKKQNPKETETNAPVKLQRTNTNPTKVVAPVKMQRTNTSTPKVEQPKEDSDEDEIFIPELGSVVVKESGLINEIVPPEDLQLVEPVKIVNPYKTPTKTANNVNNSMLNSPLTRQSVKLTSKNSTDKVPPMKVPYKGATKQDSSPSFLNMNELNTSKEDLGSLGSDPLVRPNREAPKLKHSIERTFERVTTGLEKPTSIVVRVNLPVDCDIPFKMLLVDYNHTTENILQNLEKKLAESRITIENPELSIKITQTYNDKPIYKVMTNSELPSNYLLKHNPENVQFFVVSKNSKPKTGSEFSLRESFANVNKQATKRVVEVHYVEKESGSTMSKMAMDPSDKAIDFIVKICKKKRAPIQGVISLRYEGGVYVYASEDFLYGAFEKFEKQSPKFIYSDALALITQVYLPYSVSILYKTIKMEFETTAREVMELTHQKLRTKYMPGGILSIIPYSNEPEITFKDDEKPYTIFNAYGKENCKLVYVPSLEVTVSIPDSQKLSSTKIVLGPDITTIQFIQQVLKEIGETTFTNEDCLLKIQPTPKNKFFLIAENDRIYPIYSQYKAEEVTLQIKRKRPLSSEETTEKTDAFNEERTEDAKTEDTKTEDIDGTEIDDDDEIVVPEIVSSTEEDKEDKIRRNTLPEMKTSPTQTVNTNTETTKVISNNSNNNTLIENNTTNPDKNRGEQYEYVYESDPSSPSSSSSANIITGSEKVVEVDEEEGVDVDIILQQELLFKTDKNEINWKKKWLVYTGDDLIMFKDSVSEEPEDYLEITHTTVVERGFSDFSVVNGNVTWYLKSATSQITTDTWFVTISDHCEYKMSLHN